MSDVKELLKGGYDLHVHSAPDCLPRKMDDSLRRRWEKYFQS